MHISDEAMGMFLEPFLKIALKHAREFFRILPSCKESVSIPRLYWVYICSSSRCHFGLEHALHTLYTLALNRVLGGVHYCVYLR